MELRRWRLILTSVGGIFLIWFLIPLVTTGILNIGNLTGILLFLIITLAGYYLERISDYFHDSDSHRLARILVILFSVLMILFVLVAMVESVLMVQAARQKPSSDSTVVVLGCQNDSKMMRERTRAATSYLNTNPQAKCILSGGIGSDELITEGECMYRQLVQDGISPDRLYIEGESTSTRENLEFSRQLALEKGLSTDFAIVTNEFHEYRANIAAKKLGLHSGAVPAKTEWWLFPTFYVRELYGILYEWIF